MFTVISKNTKKHLLIQINIVFPVLLVLDTPVDTSGETGILILKRLTMLIFILFKIFMIYYFIPCPIQNEAFSCIFSVFSSDSFCQ